MSVKVNINKVKQDIFLIKPNGELLDCLTAFIKANTCFFIDNYNDANEMRFEIFEKIYDKDQEYICPSYNMIELKRRILIDGYGEYIITECPEINNGIYKYKSVVCRSAEVAFDDDMITLKGSYWLYYDKDLVHNRDGEMPVTQGVLNEILKLFPDWSISHIDPILFDYTRFFDVKDQKIYQFMMNDIENAFDCTFHFDTINKTISVTYLDESIEDTNIFISYDTFVKSIKATPATEDIVTVLDVSGSGDMTLRRFDPTGQNFLYDFSYFMNPMWMSQELIDAINAWQNKIESYICDPRSPNRLPLSKDVIQLSTNAYFARKRIADREMVIADIEKKIEFLEEHIQYLEENNFSKQEIDEYESQLENLRREKILREQELGFAQTVLDECLRYLDLIIEDCKKENNFTNKQLEELRKFEFKGKYENKAFDTSYFGIEYFLSKFPNLSEVTTISYLLREQGKKELARRCKPNLKFEIDVINFSQIPELENFVIDLDVGKFIYVQIDEYTVLKLALVSIEYSRDNPKDIKLKFSDKLRYSSRLEALHSVLNEMYGNNMKIEDMENQLSDISNNLTITRKTVDNHDFTIDGHSKQINSIMNRLNDNTKLTNVIISNTKVTFQGTNNYQNWYLLEKNSKGLITKLIRKDGSVINIIQEQ